MKALDQKEQARVLRALHAQPPLVLPNAWDPGSAVAIEAAGATAIATTSAGVSWAVGVPDGGGMSRAAALDALRRIVAAVSVPVTADIEAGYGATPQEVASTITAVLATGAVGVNIEDSPGVRGEPLLDPAAQADRLAAARDSARAADVDLCINARTDTYLAGVGAPSERLAATLARAERYAAAGADLLFVPGLIDPEAIRALVDGPLPINVMAHPGAPTVAELAALGVARISVGSAVAQAAYGLAADAARELLGSGTYVSLEAAMGYGELNDLLR
ncbi:isocitrate lyase/phosphoenolpyruvate mutase family protein [Streptomyces sp. So13.3]|uniref:isocitrate lyase/PEP mutase family protein n=1 Tax=Streptomyces TaxID=1883 RepID=UPI001106A4D1|nr:MULTISPECIES: isocitrate lyase/phosphoenolpyruvate mutase family protein [Streptomyces]MCZ4095004.1 isocitrate lyase/phosphoenolpyruvate mutase family protein [Streptomyces sp. H39-C1]QNA71368.1 isocitrate lyase/phosphoenolpyruvate mutase family protein [Streptomyces sp. So13.3]